MDPITHMLTGGVVAQSVCKKNFLRQATLIGILSAAAPDLDFFVRSDFNPLLNLEIHRSFTHSLLFIPIGGLIATFIFLLLFKSWRSRWKEVFGLSTLAYATHCLLDACTSYGTQLFWPFASNRISWDILPIVAPIFTLILFLGVISTYIMESPKLARYAILIAFVYIGFAIFQHHRAMEIQAELTIARHQTPTKQNRVLPRFGTIAKWDSLYVYKNTIYLDTIYTPEFRTAYYEENFSKPLFIPNASTLPSSSLSSVKTFIWFSQDYATALSYNPLTLADLRYVQKRSDRAWALWGISWHFEQNPPMKALHFISLNNQKTSD